MSNSIRRDEKQLIAMGYVECSCGQWTQKSREYCDHCKAKLVFDKPKHSEFQERNVFRNDNFIESKLRFKN